MLGPVAAGLLAAAGSAGTVAALGGGPAAAVAAFAGAAIPSVALPATMRREARARAARAVTAERERHRRMLHDRVLQSMEMLAHGDEKTFSRLREQVAEDAAWLRDLVDSGRERPPGDLVTELERLARGLAPLGLRVAVNTAGLAAAGDVHERLSPVRVAALAEATREALVNVLKHSGTDVATVRALGGPSGVTVTIVDAGRGFDGEPAYGAGLHRSVFSRLAEAGGSALLESAGGEGTAVELRVPLA